MFVDVCFPDNNEQQYIDIALRLKTDGLCFVYQKKRVSINETRLKVFSALLADRSLIKGFDAYFTYKMPLIAKKIIYIYEGQQSRRNYFTPSSLTQVAIKEIKNSSGALGISFNYLLKCAKNPGIFEEVSFVAGLCCKYKLDMFIASFATSPYELRGKTELVAICRFMGMNTSIQKLCVNKLSALLN
jgi:hypothetical protein